MEISDIVEHPWQKTPTNLISYARELTKSEDEFKKQLGFLLLDVGVETIFTVFLSLPNEVTGVKTSYRERKEIIEKNSFHLLVLGVGEAAGERLEGVNLNKVRYFHGVRNKIYHLGDGIMPTNENIQDYEEIAVILLRALLGVDLEPKEEDWYDILLKNAGEIQKKNGVRDSIEKVKTCLMELRIDIATAVTVHSLKSF